MFFPTTCHSYPGGSKNSNAWGLKKRLNHKDKQIIGLPSLDMTSRHPRDLRSVSMLQNTPLGIWRGLGAIFVGCISYPGNAGHQSSPPAPPVLRGGDWFCGGEASAWMDLSATHGDRLKNPKTWGCFSHPFQIAKINSHGLYITGWLLTSAPGMIQATQTMQEPQGKW